MHNRKIMPIKYAKKMRKINFFIIFFLAVSFSGCSFSIGTRYPGKSFKSYGCYHIVKKGEDLYRISLYYGISVAKIEEANDMSSSNIEPGEKLFIPGVIKKQPSYALVPSAISPQYNYQEGTISNTILKQETSPETHFSSIIKNKLFIWPVKGRIVGRYGEFGNQGIDIEAKNGTSVIAAMNGVAEYIGWTEKYGSTIVIANNSDMYTIYGHDIIIKVKQGQRVLQGQIIAKINSRQSDGYLHFEIRENTTPVNPLSYLPGD